MGSAPSSAAVRLPHRIGPPARRHGAALRARAARPDHRRSRRRSPRRCGFRSRASRSRSSRRAAGGRRSSWSRRRCPCPDAKDDPRRAALAATLDELTRAGIPPGASDGARGRWAGDDARGGATSTRCCRPYARAISVAPSACTTSRTSRCGHSRARRRTRWVSPALVDTDLVVTVSAAETVLHGGPAALLGACGPSEPRAAATESLLEPTGSDGWGLATSLESRLARHVPLIGVSLVLDHPRPTGRYRGWPWEEETVTRLARARLRRLHNASPRRRSPLGRCAGSTGALDVFSALAGPPSVAHAEALLRGTALKGARARRAARRDRGAAPVGDGAPAARAPRPDRRGAHRARHRAAPVARAAPRSSPGGTVVLLHGLRPPFGRTSAAPYRALYEALREPGPEHLAQAETVAPRRPRRASTPIARDAPRTRCSPSPTGPRATRRSRTRAG